MSHQDPFYQHAKEVVEKLLQLGDNPDVPLSTHINMDGHLATVTIVSKAQPLVELVPSMSMSDAQVSAAIRRYFK